MNRQQPHGLETGAKSTAIMILHNNELLTQFMAGNPDMPIVNHCQYHIASLLAVIMTSCLCDSPSYVTSHVNLLAMIYHGFSSCICLVNLSNHLLNIICMIDILAPGSFFLRSCQLWKILAASTQSLSRYCHDPHC